MKQRTGPSKTLIPDQPSPSDVLVSHGMSAAAERGVNPSIVSTQMRILGLQICLSKQGAPYTRLYLGNSEGSLVAIAWHNNFLPCELTFEHGQVVNITGSTFVHRGQKLVKLRRIETVTPGCVSPSDLLPLEWVLPRLHDSLIGFISAWEDVRNPHLRSFLSGVFSDTATAMGLLNSPASKHYHHACQGGLLEHTAEMLAGLRSDRLYQCSSLERDLAITLVIVHDLGKTVTMVGDRFNARGSHQPHDMAALELLAEPLRQLERRLPIAANVLRGYFKPAGWFPVNKSRLYAVVSQLDRASAERGRALKES